MKRAILLRPHARDDLIRIRDLTRAAWSIDQAEDYVANLITGIDLLATQPALGSDRSHVRKGLRKLTVGAHAIFYFHDAKSVRIARIRHGRIDVDSKAMPR